MPLALPCLTSIEATSDLQQSVEEEEKKRKIQSAAEERGEACCVNLGIKRDDLLLEPPPHTHTHPPTCSVMWGRPREAPPTVTGIKVPVSTSPDGPPERRGSEREEALPPPPALQKGPLSQPRMLPSVGASH